MWIVEIVLLMVVTWWLFFFRAKAAIWIPVLAGVLLAVSYFPPHVLVTPVFAWVVFAIAVAFTWLKPLRMQLFSRPFFAYFTRVLPPMSTTEREALAAGDAWWEADLFCGKPNWKKLHAIAKPRLSKEEQHFIDKEVETLCEMVDDWQIVQVDKDLPANVWKYIKENKFLGMVIDKKYGGLGFSAFAHSCVVTKISSRSLSAAVDVMVPNSLGPGELLHRYGTQAQKDHYLPRLASGKDIPCFALTSTAVGSDATAMVDEGIICHGTHNGESVLGIRLTFEKRYITLAPIATVIGLAFKLYDPEHLLSQQENCGISVALLPANHPGVNSGRRHNPCGMAFMNGPLSGKDVFIPLDWIIGGKPMIGQGWRMLMECLSIGRSISLPSISAAGCMVNYRSLGAYAYVREQFKLPIGAFEGVQAAMAQVGGAAYLTEACRRMTAGAVDLGVKPAVASAIAKYQNTELGRLSVNHAMDVHAGRGVQMGPRNYLAHGYFGLPVAITVEGANILTRNLIVFGQGAIRCHPHIFAEMNAAAQKDLSTFDNHLVKHIAYTASNIVRMVTHSVTAGRFAKTPHSPLAHYYRQLTRMSTALAAVADLTMLNLGGKLKRKENLSARLGDVLIALYYASCVLKYHADENSPAEDLPLVKWTLETCLADIQSAFDGFFHNYPLRGLGHLVRVLIFPYGRAYYYPNDKSNRAVAQLMMRPGNLRDRLTSLCYIGNAEQPLGRVEHAFLLKIKTDELRKTLKQAIKSGKLAANLSDIEATEQALANDIIDAEQANLLNAYYQAAAEAIAVDDFANLTTMKATTPRA